MWTERKQLEVIKYVLLEQSKGRTILKEKSCRYFKKTLVQRFSEGTFMWIWIKEIVMFYKRRIANFKMHIEHTFFETKQLSNSNTLGK